jgi:hypothetical protein
MRNYFIASFLLAAACSSSPLDPGAGNSAGTGTSTLLVTGNADAHAQIANAKTAADFTTDVTVHVSLNGQDVTTGTVTINSRSMKQPLALTVDANHEWQGTIAGYDEVYELAVTAGTDKVSGVIVDGPDIHEFTAPQAGASLDSTMANMLTWERAIVADHASLRVGDLDRLAIDDTGSFSIPAGSLKAEKDQARPNTLELTRANQVVPKGAIAGSMFSVTIQNDLDVIALPNPAL